MSISVLHVTQPVVDGVARCVVTLAGDQLERGWRVAVASPPEQELVALLSGLGVEQIPWQAERSPGRTVPGETRRLAAIVERRDPDLVHLHSSKAGLAGRLALRGRRPTVFQPHAWSFLAVEGPLRTATRAWERLSARWAEAIVCVSAGERAQGEAAGIRADWRVIPNGVDLEAFRPATPGERDQARRRLDLPGEPLVVCVGRLARQKGQDLLLDAWPLVRGRLPGARLALVGAGPAEPELRARDEVGVRFAGRREDVHDWLAAADVVAAPSRWEGLSLVVLEAMARGRSVVVTDIPSHAGLVDERAIVPVGDAAALADAIVERLVDAGLNAAEASSNRRRIERAHDVRRTTAAVAELYEELLGRSSRQ